MTKTDKILQQQLLLRQMFMQTPIIIFNGLLVPRKLIVIFLMIRIQCRELHLFSHFLRTPFITELSVFFEKIKNLIEFYKTIQRTLFSNFPVVVTAASKYMERTLEGDELRINICLTFTTSSTVSFQL